MLRCKTCGGTDIKGAVKADLLLECLSLQLMGQATKALLETQGLSAEDRITNFNLSSKKKLHNVTVHDIEFITCTSCGTGGQLVDFDLIDVCRCGNITDKLGWCARYAAIVCPNCVHKVACKTCALVRECQATNLRKIEEKYNPVITIIKPRHSVTEPEPASLDLEEDDEPDDELEQPSSENLEGMAQARESVRQYIRWAGPTTTTYNTGRG